MKLDHKPEREKPEYPNPFTDQILPSPPPTCTIIQLSLYVAGGVSGECLIDKISQLSGVLGIVKISD